MTSTLTIDPKGSICLPAAFLEKFQLKPGTKLVADLNDDGMALRPDVPSTESTARLVDKDGLLVFTGTEPFDAVEAVMSARAGRESELASGLK